MADEKKKGAVKKTSDLVVKAATLPITARERLNKGLLPIAFVLGMLGMVALAGSLVLLGIPEDYWPEFAEREHLPYYLMLSLAFASLLGWGCMQKGLSRMRRKVGWMIGGWLFVGLPMACALLMLIHVHTQVDVLSWNGGPVLLLFARWFPPALIILSLVAYVTNKSRSPEDKTSVKRLVYFTGLVAPYALMMAYLVFGLRAPYINEALQDTVHGLGSYAIVLQIALAYFSGGGGSS